MKPFSSIAISLGSQSVLGAAPMKINRELAVARLLAVGGLQGQALQAAVAGHGDDLGAGFDYDVGRGFDLIDEVL